MATTTPALAINGPRLWDTIMASARIGPGRIETGTAVANCAFGDDGRTLYMTSNDFLARIRLKIDGAR